MTRQLHKKHYLSLSQGRKKMPQKRTFSIAFKAEVVNFMNIEGNTPYRAALHFSARDSRRYNEGMFHQWKNKSESNVEQCIQSVGFSARFEDWHISKHDIYGELFRQAWTNTAPREVNPDDLEAIGQEDDIDAIDCNMNDLFLDGSDDDNE